MRRLTRWARAVLQSVVSLGLNESTGRLGVGATRSPDLHRPRGCDRRRIRDEYAAALRAGSEVTVGSPLGAPLRLVRVSRETSHGSLKVNQECCGLL